MTSPEERYAIYKQCFEELPINQAELARLMAAGEKVTQSVRSKVSNKLNKVEGKGITKSEASAIQYLLLLSKMFDRLDMSVKDMEFNEDGFLKQEFVDSVMSKLPVKEGG